MEAEKTKVISVLVENKPGVLHGVANLFRRRNFNIESITVGPSEQQDICTNDNHSQRRRKNT